jgi:hypothetical protein
MPDSQLSTNFMNDSPPSIAPPTEEPQAPPLALSARLLNIFASPGEVFEQVKKSPVSNANWLVPIVLLVLASWLGSWLVFSQPAIQQQMRDITDKAIDKQIEKNHMSEAQAEQARQMGEKYGAIWARVGIVASPVVLGFSSPIIWGFVLWLMCIWGLKTHLPYIKLVELVGLGNMIGVLEVILKSLLIIVTGNLFASLGPVLLIKGFDQENTVHSLIALVNLMTLWLLAVRAIGFARLTGISTAKAATWIFGFWAAYTGLFWTLGYLVRMLMKKMTG